MQRLARLQGVRKQVGQHQAPETPFFNSVVHGPGVSYLHAEARREVPVRGDVVRLVWSEEEITELQRFVAQWISDDGWDVGKPKVRGLLRELVPGDVEVDEAAFATVAAGLIREILIALVPVLPTRRPPREDRVQEIRRIEGDRAAGRTRTGWMGGNRYASGVDRSETPRGDRSGRLHTLQAPQCLCAGVMLSEPNERVHRLNVHEGQ